MNAIHFFDRHIRVAMKRVLTNTRAQLDELQADIDMQFRAARAEVRGFSFTRSLAQQRRFHRSAHRRT